MRHSWVAYYSLWRKFKPSYSWKWALHQLTNYMCIVNCILSIIISWWIYHVYTCWCYNIYPMSQFLTNTVDYFLKFYSWTFISPSLCWCSPTILILISPLSIAWVLWIHLKNGAEYVKRILLILFKANQYQGLFSWWSILHVILSPRMLDSYY